MVLAGADGLSRQVTLTPRQADPGCLQLCAFPGNESGRGGGGRRGIGPKRGGGGGGGGKEGGGGGKGDGVLGGGMGDEVGRCQGDFYKGAGNEKG